MSIAPSEDMNASSKYVMCPLALKVPLLLLQVLARRAKECSLFSNSEVHILSLNKSNVIQLEVCPGTICIPC